jgi:hypothetical protein
MIADSRRRTHSRRRAVWRDRLARAGQVWPGARLAAVALLLVVVLTTPAHAEWIEASGEVVGADVEGTIWLTFDSAHGDLAGRIEMTVQFDCRGKRRDERHILELTKGRVEGDRIVATAVYVERSGLPKDELSRCKSAYETYQTREDSRRLIGTIDSDGQRASGTLGEYRPTVSWRIAWPPPAPAPDVAPADESAAVTPVDDAPVDDAPITSP